MNHVKCLIIGSGPAGYTAAIYAGRANLSPVVYVGQQMGGQLTQTTEIENFPGYPQGVDANQMMMELQQQAERFGADVRAGEVTGIDFTGRPYVVTVDGTDKLTADAIIIATGAKAKYLGLEDEKKYSGMGVSACATCDGFFYRKETVAVVRKDYLRASDIMQQRVKEAENIEILFKHNVTGLYGENGVEGMHVVEGKDTPEEKHYDVNIDGLFLAIGHTPVTDFVKASIKTDNQGYIVTDGKTQEVYDQEGNVIPGVFAAGDVCDPTYRQAVVAAGTGCKAALDAEKYIQSL